MRKFFAGLGTSLLRFVIALIAIAVATIAGYWFAREAGRRREDELSAQVKTYRDRAHQAEGARDQFRQQMQRGGASGALAPGGSLPQAPMPPLQSKMTSPPPIERLPVPVRQPDPVQMQTPATFQTRDLIEPGDETDHPHLLALPVDSSGFIALRDGWRVIAASRRGLGHEDEGKYREDDVIVRAVGKDGEKELVLVAIADGVGSKRLSRHGARAAVLGATGLDERGESGLRTFAERVRKTTSPDDFHTGSDVEREARRIVREAVARARHAVEDRVQKDRSQRMDPGISADDLHSTLLIFLAVPHHNGQLLIAGSQIGDGALYVHQPAPPTAALRDRWAAPLPQQVGPANNEVAPFMRMPDAEWEKYFVCVTGAFDFAMAMTDGTADDLRPPIASDGGTPDPFIYIEEFRGHIQQAIAAPPPRGPAAALLEFLGYRKKQSLDDRTVVCLYRSRK